MPVRDVVVVGGGLAGLACAAACAQAGARIELLESAASPLSRAAHLEIVPNLLRDLDTLGVAQACVRQGFAFSGSSVVDEDGTLRAELPSRRLAGPLLPPSVGIVYEDLLAILAQRARALGVCLQSGQQVLGVDAGAGRLTLADGRSRQADLVILAAGADAPIVRAVFGAPTGSSRATIWWHALIPRPHGLDQAVWMAGAVGRRLLLVPVGMAKAGIAVVHTEAMGREFDAEAMARTLGSWAALPRRLATLIQPGMPTTVRASSGSMLDGPWFRGAVLCVGASARAVAPPFGQSAAQAVEDALVLGELIGQGLDRTPLMECFMQRRGERARRVHGLVQKAVRWIDQPDASTDLLAISKQLSDIVSIPA